MRKKYWLVAATSTVFLACSSAQEPQQMFVKASALTKLTAHVDAAVLYSPTGKSENDLSLFEKAFADNLTLGHG